MEYSCECYHCGKPVKYSEKDVVMKTAGNLNVVRCTACGGLVVDNDSRKQD